MVVIGTKQLQGWLVVVAAAGTWIAQSSTALACSRIERDMPVFEVDPSLQATDNEPPPALAEVSASVYRTTGALCQVESCTVSTCGSSGTVTLHMKAGSTSDRGDDTALGLRIQVVSGIMPASMQAMVDRLHPFSEGLWFESSFDTVTELDVTITISTVDRAGNESAPSEPLELRWSGCTTFLATDGCVDEAVYACSSGGCSPRGGAAMDAVPAADEAPPGAATAETTTTHCSATRARSSGHGSTALAAGALSCLLLTRRRRRDRA